MFFPHHILLSRQLNSKLEIILLFNERLSRVLPWSHHALGDKVPAPEGAPATYTNYWGYEIELLQSISHTLNFRSDYSVR